MGARQRMTMRAVIERDFAPEDAYGSPGPPDWQIIGIEVPCYVWAGKGGGQRTAIGNQKTVTVDMPGAIFPLGTDIDGKDRLRSVGDRLGKELFGMMYIDAVLLRKDHLEARLKDYD